MDYEVLEARYLRDHIVWLRFRDGTRGEIDLAPALNGPVFEPLKDREYFRHSRSIRDFTPWCGRMVRISRRSFSTTTFA
jgi:hypothetical protein